MEKKNMVLLTVIAVATLLVAVIGATFAFFTATVQDNRETGGDTGETSLTAGSVASSTIVASVDGSAGQFTATDVYPGHKEIAALMVTADNEQGDKNSTTDIAIQYDVTNNTYAANEIKVSVYKSDSQITAVTENENGGNDYFGCHHTSGKATARDFDGEVSPDANAVKFYEECDKDYADLKNENQSSVTQVGSDQLLKTGTSTITFEDQITANASSQKAVYYYVVVEFVNDEKGDTEDEAQNASMNAQLEGTITVVPA